MATEAKITLTAEDRVTSIVRQVQGSLAALSSTVSNLGTGLGITAVVAGLRSIIGAMDELDKAAQGVGVTAKQLSELRIAAANSGVSAEKLDQALGSLNVKISDAASGNRNAVRMFQDLGVAFRDSSGNARATIDVLQDIANVFQGSADGAGKTALALESMGKAGRSMVPLLNQGAAALTQFKGVSEESVKEAAKLQNEIDKLTAAFKNFLFTIGGAVATGINKLFDKGSLQQQIGELETIIKSMEQAQVGNPANLERYKRELAQLKEQAAAEARMAATDQPGVGKQLKVTDLAEADRLRKIAEDFAKIDSEARREFQQTGLKAKLDEEAAAAKRAMGVVNEYNRALEEGVKIREEDRQAGLAANRLQEEQAAARARAQVEQFNKELEQSKKLGDDLGLVFESAVSKLFTGSEGFSAKSFFKALGDDIAQTIIKITVLEPLIRKLKEALSGVGAGQGTMVSGFLTLLGGLFGGARAGGGPVLAGMPYLVGEQGPELFVPSFAGSIVPNSGGLGVSIVQHVNVDSRSDIASVRAAMVAAKNETLREVAAQQARRGPLSRI